LRVAKRRTLLVGASLHQRIIAGRAWAVNTRVRIVVVVVVVLVVESGGRKEAGGSTTTTRTTTRTI